MSALKVIFRDDVSAIVAMRKKKEIQKHRTPTKFKSDSPLSNSKIEN